MTARDAGYHHVTGVSSIQIDERSLEGSILDRLDAVADAQPQHEAISAADGSVTYRELGCNSRRVASSLLKIADEPQSIGLLFDRGVNHFAAMLGALRCGHRFVPLEPSYPADRLRHMIEDGGCRVMLTESCHRELGSNICGGGIRMLDVDELLRQGNDDSAMPIVPPSALAMIMYTSGSTGKPKGVVHSHLTLLQNCLRRSRAVGLGGDHRTAQLEPASYVPAVTVALLSLMNGSTLCPFRVREEGIPALVRWLGEERISSMRANPSLLRAIGAAIPRGSDFPHLQIIQTGGEVVRNSDLRMFYDKRFPNCTLFISYGTTESGIIAIHCVQRSDVERGDPVPVGSPVEGVIHEVLDESGAVLPAGAEGEVAPRSAFFSLGYWNRPEETARMFEKCNGSNLVRYRTGDIGRISDGLLFHLGRRDQQVKVRGHRIECGEIESAIMSGPGVNGCAVTPYVDVAGETRLAAYVVSHSADGALDQTKRRHLSERVPAHAIPTIFIPMGALPISPNAKLDRARLPDPLEWMKRTEAPALRSASKNDEAIRRTASLLADVWQDVLRCARPGLDDSFFRLGGDSLSAMHVCLELESRFNLQLPITRMFEADTLRKQALLLSGDDTAIRSEPLIILQHGTGSRTLLCVPGIAGHAWMFRHLAAAIGPEVTVIAANFPGLDTSQRPLDTIEALAEHILRAQPTAIADPEHVSIGGYSFGGWIAYEMARRLAARNTPPRRLFLWDCFHPSQRAIGQSWMDAKRLIRRTFRIGKANRSPLEAQFAAVADGCRSAARRYKPGPYREDVSFYVTTHELNRRRNPDPNGGWKQLCTGPFARRSFEVPHIDLFRIPAATTLARAISEDLGLKPLSDSIDPNHHTQSTTWRPSAVSPASP